MRFCATLTYKPQTSSSEAIERRLELEDNPVDGIEAVSEWWIQSTNRNGPSAFWVFETDRVESTMELVGRLDDLFYVDVSPVIDATSGLQAVRQMVGQQGRATT
jgi:hypothetical protein